MNAPLIDELRLARSEKTPRSHKKLRVALFSGNYNYVMDGPVRALNKLVAHLQGRGHEVLVFAPTVSNPAFDHVGELVSIPSIPGFGSRKEYRVGLGLFGEAKAKLDAFAPNLIHIAAPDLTGSLAQRYAQQRAITTVASYHTRFDTYLRYYNLTWLERHASRYMRRFYGRCAHVYVPSQSMSAQMMREGYKDNFRLWQRGVDRDIFNPHQRDMRWRAEQGFDNNDIIVLFVGRLVKEKGLDFLVEATKRASKANPRIKTLIVGEGPERAQLQLDLPDAIFTGFLQGEDLARAYASADVFFNPSLTETFGNVTLEAMACGLPSVCAAASGALSLVKDGFNGLLSDPANGASGFAGKLISLSGDGNLRREYSLNAVGRAQTYSWTTILDGLIDDYYEAIGDHQDQPKPVGV